MKPAGTSSRSPCHPQRRTPSTIVMICSCGLMVGANSVQPSADRTSSGIIAGGECRLGAGLKSKSKAGPAITGRANWVNAKPRNSASLGTVAGSISIDATGCVNHPFESPARSRSATSLIRDPSSDRSTRTPSGRWATPNSITPATVALPLPCPRRLPCPGRLLSPVRRLRDQSALSRRILITHCRVVARRSGFDDREAGHERLEVVEDGVEGCPVAFDRSRARGDQFGKCRVLRGQRDQVRP